MQNSIAVGIGTVVTLVASMIAPIMLRFVSYGDVPLLLIGLVALFCAILGGSVAAWLGQTDQMRLGTASGLSAGLVVCLSAVVAGDLTLHTTLLGAVLVGLWAISGGAGATLALCWLVRHIDRRLPGKMDVSGTWTLVADAVETR